MTDILAILAISAAVTTLLLLAYEAGKLRVEDRIIRGGDPHIDNLVDAFANDARRRVEARQGLNHD